MHQAGQLTGTGTGMQGMPSRGDHTHAYARVRIQRDRDREKNQKRGKTIQQRQAVSTYKQLKNSLSTHGALLLPVGKSPHSNRERER